MAQEELNNKTNDEDYVHFITYKDNFIFGADVTNCYNKLIEKLSKKGLCLFPSFDDCRHGIVTVEFFKNLLSQHKYRII